MTQARSQRRESGFTIVELFVVITISGLLMGILFGPLYDMYESNDRSIRATLQTGQAREALQRIQESIATSYSFLPNNEVTDPSGTSWSASSGNVLITNNYALTIEPNADSVLSPARNIVFATDCDTPIYNNVVYFVQSQTLIRRVLKNPTTAICSGTTWTQRTFDAKIAYNIQSFTVTYYTAANAVTTTPASAKSVLISLTTVPTTRDPSVTSKLRITRTNGT